MTAAEAPIHPALALEMERLQGFTQDATPFSKSAMMLLVTLTPRPLTNSNRFINLSIIASKRSSTSNSFINRLSVAAFEISSNSPAASSSLGVPSALCSPWFACPIAERSQQRA
jgi:hypothetical protein